MIARADLAVGQAQLHRTLVVDKSDNYDHTSIQSAINDNRIGSDPSERWTILIYAGTYDTEAITLDDTQENIDLVGVDRDAVIIKPPTGYDAITIEGFGARNNSIRNLTIQTTSGHGIEIVKGGGGSDKTPKAITIEGVTIEANGTGKDGISASAVQKLYVRDCDITANGRHGIGIADAASDIEIQDVRILCAGEASGGICFAAGVTDALIRDVTIRSARGNGIEVTRGDEASGRPSRNIEIEDIRIQTRAANSYALKADGANSITRGERVRIDALTLYPESDDTERLPAARKP